MAATDDEHEHTMAFAEIALGQIKALRQPAIPRNYQLWYSYATGFHPTLNQAINESLARSGTLSPADIDQLYETHFASTRLTDRLDGVGAKVVDEIDQVMAMIDAAVGSANSYTESLADVTQQLGTTKDREGLRAIVQSLIVTAKEMERSNQTLENRLSASKQEIHQLQQSLEAVRSESLTDPLTALANRKYFDEALYKAIESANRTGVPLALLIIDIDHFKKFNDLFGHVTGDQVLRLVAMSVKQNTKGQDIAARYGGEEFAVILPETGLKQALTVADYIRRAVMTKDLVKRSTGERLGRITVSLGVATYRAGESGQALIERADSCLYVAKGNGRNRVVCETDPEYEPQARSNVA